MNTLLAFLVTLGVLIVVHEWGHYRVARACGVKVLKFSIGFGPTLWRRQVGETEWAISALPLGGFVRMLDEREGPVAPHELHRAFNRKSLRQRSAVVLAGPLANLVLAALLFAASSWIGLEAPRAVIGSPAAGSLAEQAGLTAGTWVRRWAPVQADADTGAQSLPVEDWQDVASLTDLHWQVVQAALEGRDLRLESTEIDGGGRRQTLLALSRLQARDVDADLVRRIGLSAPYSEPVIGDVKPGGPAARAGLQSGDRVLRVDGRDVADTASLRALIFASGAQGQPLPQSWQVERSGRLVPIEVTPVRMEEQGRAFGRIEAVIGTPPRTDVVTRGAVDGLVHGMRQTWEHSVLTLRMFGRMLTGEASLRNVSGPFTMADFAGRAAERGLSSLLVAMAVISVSLGVLNLLPVPMLDGGHLLYYLIEGAIGRPLPDRWVARLQQGGLVAILLLMSLALYNDMAPRLGLH